MNTEPIQLPPVIVTPTRDLESDRLVLILAIAALRWLSKP